MMKRRLIFLIYLQVIVFGGFAQEIATKPEAAIKVVSKVDSETVFLRWAPDDPAAWKLLNGKGYRLFRYTLSINGKMIKNAKKTRTELTTIFPEPLEAWKSYIRTSDEAAIAAQAIYGESFVVEGNTSHLLDIVNKSRELKNRFSFAIFSADQSFDVARMMGLAYIDTTARKNMKYLYEICPLVSREMLYIDTAKILVETDRKFELPEPVDLKAEYIDKSVMLTWPVFYYKGIYTNYVIERSDDGGHTFQKVSEKPLLIESQEAQQGYYVDSLPAYAKTYWYRLQGVTPFGDKGPVTDSVEVEAYMKLKSNPKIISIEEYSNDTVSIHWEFPEKYNIANRGFRILSSNAVNSPYMPVDSSFISPEKRTCSLLLPGAINYVVVESEDFGGNRYHSPPKMLQRTDSIPPSAPVGLKGVVDSTGHVTVNWEPNQEKDILGYRLFFSNSPEDEFSPLVNSTIKEHQYEYKVSLNTLSKSIYYKVIAIDQFLNRSGFSKVIQVERPDTIAPTAPVFVDYSVKSHWIYTQWEPSQSSDLKQHVLIRKNLENFEIDTLLQVPANSGKKFHSDYEITPGITYEYLVYAEDKSGNRAKCLQPLQLKKTSNRKIQIHAQGNADPAEKGITLSWYIPGETATLFHIYKQDEKGRLRLYKTLSGDVFYFTDQNVRTNQSYVYRIRSNLKNGTSTTFSDEIKVTY
jgi:hypothetical protein